MAASVGRTVGKYVKFQIHDTGAAFRDIPVTSINGVGLAYPEVDVSAIQDAVKGALNGQPDFTLSITGPFDTTAAVTASGSGAVAALSGSHTVLKNLPNDLDPLSFAIYVGIRHAWTSGEPSFGVSTTSSGTGGISGLLCMGYNVDPIAATYEATFRLAPGSIAPIWHTKVWT